MQTKYGRAYLTKMVGTQEDLDKMILSVDKLPDINEVVDGTVMQLRAPSNEYSETHFYRADKTGGKNEWVDITDVFVSSMESIADSAAGYAYETTGVEPDEEYTGYLKLYWTKQPDLAATDPLLYTIVVRKLGDHPINPEDGQILAKIPASEQGYEGVRSVYTVFDDGVCDTELAVQYKYVVFHMYGSCIKYTKIG